MFKVNEIKSWAGKHGISVKKQGDGYVWMKEGVEPGVPSPIEDVALQIFNQITDFKYVDHQKSFREGFTQ